MATTESGRTRRFSLDAITKGMSGTKSSSKKKSRSKGKGGPPSTRGSNVDITLSKSITKGLPLDGKKLIMDLKPSASDNFPSREVDAKTVQEMMVTNENWSKAIELVLLLGKDARLLLAHGLLQKVDALAETTDEATKAAIQRELGSAANKRDVDRIRTRGTACSIALTPEKGNEGWIFAQSLFGMDTYYKYIDGKLFCKVEGAFTDCSVMDQLAIIREGDLWNKWAPFVSKSALLKRFGPCADMALHFTLNMPLLVRDCVVRGYACDNMEDQTILLMGDSAETAADLEVDALPPKPTGWVSDRMDVKNFRCKIKCSGPTSGHVVLSAILDPKTNLPANLVNFATKQLVGVLIYLLQEASRKIKADPTKNAHAKKIREESHFYRTWLLPRSRHYSKLHGWKHTGMIALQGFEPPTPGLTPVTGMSDDSMTARAPATAAGDVGSSVGGFTGTPATANTNETAKAKKKKLKFNFFKKSKKNKGGEPAALREDPIAAVPTPTGIFAMLSPARLLSPIKSPVKSARAKTPHSIRGSPYKRANAPYTFALIIASYFALKASAMAIAVRSVAGLAGETFFLTALLQAVLHLSVQHGFFEAAYVGRIFDERSHLTLPSARFALGAMTLAGGMIASLAATLRVYRVEIILVPREHLPAGEWSRAASALTQWWSTALTLILALVIAKPEWARQILKWSPGSTLSA